MSIALSPKLSFAEFLQNCPSEGRYEFVEGEIVRILATRQHDNVADFIAKRLDREIDRLSLDYRVSGRISVVTTTSNGLQQSRNPDVSVVPKAIWNANLLSYQPLLDPLQVAIEVVSSNWEDDYIDKLDEYQRSGITEFWIVDYLALGSRTYLGNPKHPALFVHTLLEGQYQCQKFSLDQAITSPTFPQLQLTLAEILAAAEGLV
jgi:Uma2 family endonuclease